jgi:hypothetical protein
MFALPQLSRVEPAIFVGTSGATGTEWKNWLKPPGVTMVYILAIGGGGGGGGGFTRATGNAGGGGGGGGSGAMSTLLIPACVLPDSLYVQAGAGGVGGTANGNGSNGVVSQVSIGPGTAAQNLILLANSGGAATAGTSGAGGSPGSGGGASTANAMVYSPTRAYRAVHGRADRGRGWRPDRGRGHVNRARVYERPGDRRSRWSGHH